MSFSVYQLLIILFKANVTTFLAVVSPFVDILIAQWLW